LKRIGREPCRQALHLKRCRFRGDVYLKVAPCAPIQRSESALAAASTDEFIVETLNVTAGNLIAIAFLSTRIIQSLRIGQSNIRITAAADHQDGIRGLQLAIVQ